MMTLLALVLDLTVLVLIPAVEVSISTVSSATWASRGDGLAGFMVSTVVLGCEEDWAFRVVVIMAATTGDTQFPTFLCAAVGPLLVATSGP